MKTDQTVFCNKHPQQVRHGGSTETASALAVHLEEPQADLLSRSKLAAHCREQAEHHNVHLEQTWALAASIKAGLVTSYNRWLIDLPDLVWCGGCHSLGAPKDEADGKAIAHRTKHRPSHSEGRRPEHEQKGLSSGLDSRRCRHSCKATPCSAKAGSCAKLHSVRSTIYRQKSSQSSAIHFHPFGQAPAHQRPMHQERARHQMQRMRLHRMKADKIQNATHSLPTEASAHSSRFAL